MRLRDLLAGKKRLPRSPAELLRAAQTASPPSEPKRDLGKIIYQRLAPRLDSATRDLFTQNLLSVGEIGLNSPNAMAEFVEPSGYVIRVHSGMAHLFGYISRSIMGGATLRSRAEPEQGTAPTLSQDDVTERVAAILIALKQTGQIEKLSLDDLSPTQANFSQKMAEAAEDFVVAHELGHITAWRARGGDPGAIAPEEEYIADFHALHFVLGAHASIPVQDRTDRRVAYAGAELALRIFASLEHLGYPFETTHPLPRRTLGGTAQNRTPAFSDPPSLFGSQHDRVHIRSTARGDRSQNRRRDPRQTFCRWA